ncbi:hypothetical protein [Streptomyces durocortorensis]|uniref:Uncharacterized protein n=1 Tax=Streptomyces durocortorensis TaxID=2811104 RepID=A0ABS2I249_9ACTN|nr:hypothetical protein [Streptomyces durocortorensis]MBM7056698.1 hypothetical protein [Streptomyces durocortorensis]
MTVLPRRSSDDVVAVLVHEVEPQRRHDLVHPLGVLAVGGFTGFLLQGASRVEAP